jgi:hypothetical protein
MRCAADQLHILVQQCSAAARNHGTTLELKLQLQLVVWLSQ